MHFHLPKPLHGWREFAGEVGIIVIGVLIALGAEQVVGVVHDRSVANQTREALRGEIGNNLASMLNRQSKLPCTERRLNDIARMLSEARAGKSLEGVTWIGRPPLSAVQTAQWQAASSSGRLNLLRQDEQADYGYIYGQLLDFHVAEIEEQKVWARLRGIAGITKLSDVQDADLTNALHEARYFSWWLRVTGGYAEDVAGSDRIRPVGLKPTKSTLCIPTNTPVEQALKQANRPRFGEPL